MGTTLGTVCRLARAPALAFMFMLPGATGCYEGVGGSGANGDTDGSASTGATGETDGDAPQPEADHAARSGLRRLSAVEYDACIRDLLQEEPPPAELLLPADARTPFDNDYTTQSPSPALIEGAELLASDAIDRLLADTDRLSTVLGCAPSGFDDAGCMSEFIARFGRRAIRRPLTSDEIDLFLHGTTGSDGALDHAQAAGSFEAGVDHFLRAILQDVEFLYRVEIGTPSPETPGLHILNDHEVATRLSFLLWGSGPDEVLLDAAEVGDLADAEGLWAQAERMLEDPRARARARRFHAMWLGFEQLPHDPELSADMRAETNALLDRVLFDEARPWQDVFRLDETYLTELLAQNYDMAHPSPGTPAWVPYDDERRRGLLSHGSFLSNGIKFGDTSPVQRGLVVRRRLFCQDIPPPPPGVNTDEPPESDALCKPDVYAGHREGACASCHTLIDPVGFGLESFDAAGRFRTHQPDYELTPDDESVCEIEGVGEVSGVGSFSGPAELAQLGLQEGLISPCMATQLYRYAVGRFELDDTDTAAVEALLTRVGTEEFHYAELLQEIVTSPAFRHRSEEEV